MQHMDHAEPEHQVANIDDLIATPGSDSLVLTYKEQTILDLWNQEEELRLEQALLHVQQKGPSSPGLLTVSDDDLEQELKKAEQQALEARAAYTLRGRVIQQVVITDPILKAVHTGGTNNALEQKLLALVNERDVLAMVNAMLSKELFAVTQDLSSTEGESIRLTASNATTASEMLRLADQARERTRGNTEDIALQEHVRTLDGQIQTARRDWRIIKSIVSALVVNSGIPWSHSSKLRKLVLDNEDELG